MTQDAFDPPEQAVRARLDPASSRFVIGIVMLMGLAIMLGFAALNFAELATAARVVFVAMALLIAWLASAIYRAGRKSLILTNDGLYDSDGVLLCTVDQIESADRSAFAFKPSNGFLIRLNCAPGRAWHPGLWWRIGKRIGIGGITPGGQGRFMADQIALMVRDRTEGTS